MVIGNGMMAKAFSKFKNDNSVIVFASGVSNSKETERSRFDRELKLIEQFKNTESKFIYFSTCSLFDSSLSNSLYVSHKKNIEHYITEHFKNYWIIRLPNVVGKSTNANTMTNFLYNCIKNEIHFELQENAHRYFIDVDDVKNIITKMISDNTLKNDTYNLLYPKALNVKALVELIEKELNKKATYNVSTQQGSFYEVENSNKLLSYINFNNIDSQNYIRNIIHKYYQ